MISTSKSNDNPAMLLALKVLKDQAKIVPNQYREDLVFLISWFLFNPMSIDHSDKIWTMIQNYISHFANAKAGEPAFLVLKREIEKDPAPVQKRLGVSQELLAAEADLPNQETIARFWKVKKKKPEYVWRMTAVLGLKQGLGNDLA